MRILFLLAALGPATSEPAPQRWQLDQQPKQCIALRERAGDRLGVAITVRPFEKYHDVTVIAPKSGARRGGLPVTLTIAGTAVDRKIHTRVREPADSHDRVFIVGMSAEQLRAAEDAGTFSATVAGNQSYEVPMKGAGKVLTALAECEKRLVAAMGITRNWVVPAAEASDFVGLVRSDDYPLAMIESNRQGGVAVLLEIDPAGVVSRCVSYELYGDPMFERVVCGAIKKRARFTPARDRAGNAVKSYYLSPIVWFVME